MTKTSQNEKIEIMGDWTAGLFESLEDEIGGKISDLSEIDPDLDGLFDDLDEPTQIDTADDWIVSNPEDLARAEAARPGTIRMLLASLTESHQHAALAQQVAEAVREHGLAPHWLDYTNAHVA
jgi:hypothetical protein